MQLFSSCAISAHADSAKTTCWDFQSSPRLNFLFMSKEQFWQDKWYIGISQAMVIWTFDVDASAVAVVMMRIKGIQYRLYHKGALCDACVCTKAIMATKATNIYKCKSDKCKLEVQTWWQLHIKHHSCSFVSLARFLFIFDTHCNRYIGKVCLQYIYWIGVVATAILNRCVAIY